MCFSATASFITASVTGVVGILALSRVNNAREIPLAMVPVFFAAQQVIEGSLWLNLPSDPHGPVATALTLTFLLFAEVLWPMYAPITIWLVEPSARRRHLMLIFIATGLIVSLYLLWWILTHSHSAAIVADHIDYVTEDRHSDVLGVAYLAATCFPMLFSSRRTVTMLGVIVLVGSATAYVFYWEAFTSVWCFFAAAASIVILGHFERARRHRLGFAGA